MSTMAFINNDPFFQVQRTVTTTTQGPVQLPILYYKVRNLNAFFMVPVDKVQASLNATGAGGLKPACQWGGKALVALACYEYDQTSIGSYNEIGLAVPVVRPNVKPGLRHWLQTMADVDQPQRDLGFYVLHLPVDTDVACAAGREIWGLPKFVTPIEYGREGKRVDIVLSDPQAPRQREHAILSLTGELGASVPGPSLSPLLFSEKGGKWIQTPVNVRGGGQVFRGAGVTLSLGQSTHPMVDTLRQLGLDGAHPWMVMDTDRFQSRLNDGRRMA